MLEPYVHALIKFGQQEHLEELRRTGRFRMLQLSTFQNMEDDVGRGDRDDGLSAVYQPDQIRMSVMGIDIPSEAIVGPIKIARTITSKCHVFCMHAITSERVIAFLNQKAPLIDPNNLRLGSHALIILNGIEFLRRVRLAAKKLHIELDAKLVNYVDPATHHGSVDAFTKFSSYAYQAEWRFLTSPSEEGILWLPVEQGLEDISMVVPIAELDQLKVQSRIPQ